MRSIVLALALTLSVAAPASAVDRDDVVKQRVLSQSIQDGFLEPDAVVDNLQAFLDLSVAAQNTLLRSDIDEQIQKLDNEIAKGQASIIRRQTLQTDLRALRDSL